jgi:hypothetical protein
MVVGLNINKTHGWEDVIFNLKGRCVLENIGNTKEMFIVLTPFRSKIYTPSLPKTLPQKLTKHALESRSIWEKVP